MKKIILTALALIALSATLVAPLSFAASCGTNSDGKPIKTSIDYGCNSGDGNGIMQIFLVAVNFLAIGVGIAVVGGIVFGALRYSSANGNASQAQQGITYIINSVIALVLFIFMYAIINFLVPGGLFT